MDSFNFDAWVELAKASPDEFEQRRCDVVESLISNSDGNIRRLRGLQCNIDMERIRARTPLKACLRISSLMSDSFLKMNDELKMFVELDCETTSISSHSRSGAKIIHISTEYEQNTSTCKSSLTSSISEARPFKTSSENGNN